MLVKSQVVTNNMLCRVSACECGQVTQQIKKNAKKLGPCNIIGLKW